MRIVDPSSADGALSEVKAGQRVWLRLSADATRAHTPSLKLRLLADRHPDVRAAIAAKASSTCDTAASSSRNPKGILKGITCTSEDVAMEETLSRHTNAANQLSSQSGAGNTISSAPLAASHTVDSAHSTPRGVHGTQGAAHVDCLPVKASSGGGGVGRLRRPAALPRSHKTPVVCVADAIARGLAEALRSAHSAAGPHEAAAAAPQLVESSCLPPYPPAVLPEVSPTVAAQVGKGSSITFFRPVYVSRDYSAMIVTHRTHDLND